jgi:hypothetical protein
MKRLLHSPFLGLIVTGIIASAALLLEPWLQAPQDIHFLFQFLWVGVVGAALLLAALRPIIKTAVNPVSPQEATPEFLDEDRVWLQTHPDTNPNEQV